VLRHESHIVCTVTVPWKRRNISPRPVSLTESTPTKGGFA
jgi:hypothetical protein